MKELSMNDINPFNLYFAIDGLDGCGKSSAVKDLASILKKSYGQECGMTREIGGTPLAEEIRKLVLRPSQEESDPLTDLLLVEAARSDQRRCISRFMEDDPYKAIISDRCEASTYAYQVYAGDASRALFNQLEGLHTTYPSLYLYLKVDPETAFKRMNKRGLSDKFEEKNLEFFKRVSEGYDEYFDEMGLQGRAVEVIDANGSLQDTYLQLEEIASRIAF